MEEENPEGVSQSTMRFFVRHMSNSAKRVQKREEKIAQLDSQISVLRNTALSKKPNREELEQGFDSLGLRIRDMVSNERMLIASQQKEQREIEELRERIDILEEKLNGLGHINSMTSQDHMRRIDDLSRRIGGSIGHGPSSQILSRQMKEERPANRHNLHPMMTARDIEREKRHSEIGKLNDMIREAEKALRAGGKRIKKEQEESMRRKIKIYKRRIKSIKE